MARETFIGRRNAARRYVILDSDYNVRFSNGIPPEITGNGGGHARRLPEFIEQTVRQICGAWHNAAAAPAAAASLVAPGTLMRVFPLSGGTPWNIGVAFEPYRIRRDDVTVV